ncbi:MULTISPECIES: hypothetical protein [unclassified Crossiella]|uniref:hypothetical protein n=1 Tax=unclassified Crossiella TaxID=2620835 RepID=UPI001FFEE378|nr:MULTISPECIES: hypothetical protein [unclassified Crossiella]MCK2243137.1 hypothetical protein [Crossiella sp. S99.2]MCK2257014.1 hypothetical protein [Crossiella sp. S99.1]
MTFDAETVVAWAELPTAELRVNAQRLAAARLPANHPLWTVIRERPALAAKLRSAFSGLLVTIKGSRDEHMQRLWITAARNSIDAKPAPEPKPVAEKKPVADKPVVVAPVRAEPAPAERPRQSMVSQPQFAPPPPAQSSRSAAPIPQVVFQEP